MSSSSSGNRGNAFGFWHHVAKWTMPEEEGPACGNCPTPAVAAKTPFRGPINLRTKALKSNTRNPVAPHGVISLLRRTQTLIFYACCRCWRGKPQLCFCQDVARIKGTRASQNKKIKIRRVSIRRQKGDFFRLKLRNASTPFIWGPANKRHYYFSYSFFPRMGH